jgi:hypothetical protein
VELESVILSEARPTTEGKPSAVGDAEPDAATPRSFGGYDPRLDCDPAGYAEAPSSLRSSG